MARIFKITATELCARLELERPLRAKFMQAVAVFRRGPGRLGALLECSPAWVSLKHSPGMPSCAAAALRQLVAVSQYDWERGELLALLEQVIDAGKSDACILVIKSSQL